MTQTVLILGASGKIGRHSADAFERAGWRVRRFERSADTLMEAARGADVIVNGFNPAGYKNWKTLVPRYTREVIAAAKAHGCTIVVPGNVYVYGNHPGTWGPDTPHLATTRKGKIRIEMERAYREAAREGVQTILLRAGDFLDPNRDGTLMSLVCLREIEKGKLTTLGDPEARHAYTYLPDWARAAVALAEMREELECYEDIPFAGTSFSMNELVEAIGAACERPIRLAHFPWWLMLVASPFWKTAYEMLEMRYLSSVDHVLDPERMAALLPGFKPTSKLEVMLCEVPEHLPRPELQARLGRKLATAAAKYRSQMRIR